MFEFVVYAFLEVGQAGSDVIGGAVEAGEGFVCCGFAAFEEEPVWGSEGVSWK